MNPSAAIARPEATRKLPTTGFLVWLPAVTAMLLTTLSYIDRNTLALLSPTILRETNLSNTQYGFIISAFSIAYMLCNPLWGRVVDRVGVRMSMATAVSLWTLASVSHAFASGLRGLLFARTALGLGEAATYPGAVRTATQTLPPQAHMRGCGLVYSGGALGAVLTPIIMTPVALAWGWRGAFWFTGAAGALWLALWSIVSRQRDLARPTITAEPATRPRWNDPRLWAFICLNLGGIPLAFVFYEVPIYLSEVFHKSQLEIGLVLWIPPLGWDIGNLFWGWVTDRFARGGASMPALRRQLFLLMLMSLPLAAVPHIRSYPITVAMLSFATFVIGGNTISVIAYGTRVYSTARSGFVAGVVSGAWSAFVALVMPVVGRLFDLHWYNGAFALAASGPVVGYLVWRKLH